MGEQLDITGAKRVEVRVRDDGCVVWVNVDGLCRLRVCRIEEAVRIEGPFGSLAFTPTKTPVTGLVDAVGALEDEACAAVERHGMDWPFGRI